MLQGTGDEGFGRWGTVYPVIYISEMTFDVGYTTVFMSDRWE
jgi:hypothetical protein